MNLANGNYKVESITVVEALSHPNSLMEIKFENQSSKVFMFGIYADMLSYLNQEVMVDLRQEIIKGNLVQCVNSLTVIAKVNTLERNKSIKLFVDNMPQTASNVVFDDIAIGDVVNEAIVYCTNHKFDSSAKASWADLTILDKNRVSSKVRLFDPERKDINFSGKYIRLDLRKTKFGFNTTDIYITEGLQSSSNPEIEIALTYLKEILADDSGLDAFVKSTNLIQKWSTYIDEHEPEAGYMLVRIAMEVAQAREFANITPNIDIQLLIRGIFVNRSYCTLDQEVVPLSVTTQNILNLLNHGKLIVSKKLLAIIEETPKLELLEKITYNNIKRTVDDIIAARKFRKYSLSTESRWK